MGCLLKALDRHVEERWAKMYILRWLEAPVQQPDGTLVQKHGKGTPQGGVISLTIQEIAVRVNPQMRGIIRYYGRFKLWELQRLMFHFEFRLVKWVLNKYRKFKDSQTKAYQWLKELKKSYPTMFYYWTIFKHV